MEIRLELLENVLGGSESIELKLMYKWATAEFANAVGETYVIALKSISLHSFRRSIGNHFRLKQTRKIMKLK